MSSQVTLSLPDAISEAEAKLCLAMTLFDRGRLSCGQSAELAGYSKPTFMELLGKHGIPVFNHASDELESDLQNARAASSRQ